MAVAESYDLTLWQEIITNIIHSAAVTVKRTSRGHISQEEKGGGEAKRPQFCSQSKKMLMQNVFPLVHSFFFKREDFSYHAKLDSDSDNGS